MRSVLSLCQALRRRGIELSVVATTADGSRELVAGRRDYDGVPVSYFERDFPRRFFRSRELAQEVDRRLGEDPPSIVHLHGLWNWSIWSAAAACMAHRVPYVLSPRGMLTPSAMAHHALRKTISYRFVDERVLRGASAIHVTSSAEQESIERRAGRRAVLIPNGVSVPPPSELGPPRMRKRLGVPDNDCLFVYLGRLHRIKRLDLLIAAFRRLEQTRDDCWLVLAGPEDGVRRDELLRIAGESRVRVIGPLEGPDKWSLLAESDALVLCSDSESFGMSVAEAQACGRPVVVSRTCPWSLVEEYQSGFWVDQDEPALADAMARIAGDPDEARDMGKRGRRLASEELDWSQLAQRMAALYREIAEPAPAASLAR